ncbi:MAG: ribokinase [Paracoccaceae bacterium]
MTLTEAEIAIVGSLHYDILVTGGDRPRKGETVFGTGWTWKCGGKGGNQAIEAARHGASTAFVGAVGQDNFGDAMLATMGAAGVDTSSIARVDGAGSGMSVAIFDPEGDYGAVIVPGANWKITPQSLGAATALQTCRILLLQNEVRPETNLAAARVAKAQGARVILNAAPFRDLSPELAQLVDILVVNEIEAEQLSGSGAVDDFDNAGRAASALLALVPAVIITLGGTGLLTAARGEGQIRIAGHAVQVVSTHGAGDCLIGALGARLVLGDTLAEAARYANAAAAVLVSTPDADRMGLRKNATEDLLRVSLPS